MKIKKQLKKANICKTCGNKIRGLNHMNGDHHKLKRKG